MRDQTDVALGLSTGSTPLEHDRTFAAKHVICREREGDFNYYRDRKNKRVAGLHFLCQCKRTHFIRLCDDGAPKLFGENGLLWDHQLLRPTVYGALNFVCGWQGRLVRGAFIYGP